MEHRDFFISYTKRNKAWAVWVANVLISLGYTVYMQELDIKPGENFIEKMNEFLRNSGGFIAIWSKAYSESRYCMTEMQAAFNEWHKKRMEHFLIVCVDNHPVEPLFSMLVHVDLPDRGAVSEKKLADAVDCCATLSVPTSKPPTPTKSARTGVWKGIVVLFVIALLFVVARLVWSLQKKPSESLTVKPIETLPVEPTAEELFQWGQDSYNNGNYGVARNYFERAAAQGYAAALNQLGGLYHNGLGVETDYDAARRYYQQAADKGNKYALYNLGILYEYGYGVDIDLEKALDYYQKAADAGDEDAAAKVEELTEKLREEAEELYRQGWHYHYGKGVEVDYEKAREYYEQAAAKGNADALFELGQLYFSGIGVDVNYAKARDYYERAAAKGNEWALNNLGVLYRKGLGVEADYAKARDYYEQAAAKGNEYALYNLGYLYEYGYGVDVDSEKALDYYQKAASIDPIIGNPTAGYPTAAEKVEELRKKLY